MQASIAFNGGPVPAATCYDVFGGWTCAWPYPQNRIRATLKCLVSRRLGTIPICYHFAKEHTWLGVFRNSGHFSVSKPKRRPLKTLILRAPTQKISTNLLSPQSRISRFGGCARVRVKGLQPARRDSRDLPVRSQSNPILRALKATRTLGAKRGGLSRCGQI